MAKRKVVKFLGEVPATWEEALQQYLSYQQARSLSRETLAGQEREVTIFFRRHPEAWQGGSKLKQAVYAHFGEEVKPAITIYGLPISSSSFLGACVKAFSRKTRLQGSGREKTAAGW